ncbi:MAG: glycoside hydrolase family 5 protein [Acetatifactor sp.]|nr:glycoside hydrolase family 5 protein [Acetatifactor sp.]
MSNKRLKAFAIVFAAALLAGCGKNTEAVTEPAAEEVVEEVSTETEEAESEETAEAEETEAEEVVAEEPYVEREENDTMVENPFLKADGKVLRNNSGEGDVIQLKGTNVGGYLLQEMWMTPTRATSAVKDETDILDILVERFGEEEGMALVEAYQDNFMTDRDFDYLKSIGVNCLRLPLWWRNLMDAEGNYYDNAFERIDWFVEQSAARGMYVIIDLHGAPGSQNGSDHSGVDGGGDKMAASEFFFADQETVAANQELFYQIWEKIAEHYNGNPWVAGYDLLNEPFCTYRYNSGYTDTALRQGLWNVYDAAYKRIRAIDPDHVIIMEAVWDPVDLPLPTKFGWENIMYEYHNYLYDDYNNAGGKQVTNMRSKLSAIDSSNYDVPSLMGEFSLFDNLEAWDEGLKYINDSGISWTTWTYKTILDDGNWGIRHIKNSNIGLDSADYDKIMEAYSEVGNSRENSGLVQVLTKYFKMAYKIAK